MRLRIDISIYDSYNNIKREQEVIHEQEGNGLDKAA